MTTFSAMDIGRTGAGFNKYWMDTIAHNLANVNTVNPAGEDPFRSRMVVAQSLAGPFAPTGSGVGVRAVLEDGADAAQIYDPNHPLADEDGLITMPVVDMAAEMTNLIIANRSYQMNLKTIETGREAYQAALRLGQR
jgi:flagellar basal-body rod protein FlgC